jgi:hypothetical protein
MVNSLNLRKVQIFGDSKVVIEWVNGKFSLHVVSLNALKTQICSFLVEMENWFSRYHIFR